MINIHVVTVDHISGGNLIRNKQDVVMTVKKVKYTPFGICLTRNLYDMYVQYPSIRIQ